MIVISEREFNRKHLEYRLKEEGGYMAKKKAKAKKKSKKKNKKKSKKRK